MITIKEIIKPKCAKCQFYKEGICYYIPDVDTIGCIKEKE